MIAFEIKGGQKEAFKFLNSLKLIKLAVSLGSTESLVQHPATMTHVGLTDELKAEIGINQSLIRLSVGVEHAEDLISDISQGLEAVNLDIEISNLSLKSELTQLI
jgi:methionine-gamma-lyase